MALIVEDGTLVSGANSYVSLADAQKYLDDRGDTTVITEGLLLRAADYINSFRLRFRGFKQTPLTSSMQWPRAYAVIDDYLIPPSVIPDVIPSAQIETAIEFANQRDPYATIDSRIVKREKAQDFEREFDTKVGSGMATFDHRRVMSLLYPLFSDHGVRITR